MSLENAINKLTKAITANTMPAANMPGSFQDFIKKMREPSPYPNYMRIGSCDISDTQKEATCCFKTIAGQNGQTCAQKCGSSKIVYIPGPCPQDGLFGLVW